MKERIEEPRAEEIFPELPEGAAGTLQEPQHDLAQPDLPPPDPAQSGSAQPIERIVSWLRLAYAIEFLLALLATLTLWSEVGGQGHLDMMPWYTKLVCLMASAWCTVRFTAGLVEERKAFNRRTRIWLLGLVLVAAAMAAITYYYHLHEEMDEQDSEETAATAMNTQPRLVIPLE